MSYNYPEEAQEAIEILATMLEEFDKELISDEYEIISETIRLLNLYYA